MSSPQSFRIGLLQCDSVKAELQNAHGNYPAMFRAGFAPWIESGEVELEVFNLVDGEYPESPSVCNGWITTGSQFSVTDGSPWIHWLAEFTRTVYRTGPGLVGICFGHQMIAHALGGKVNVSEKGWGIGLARTEVFRQENWMKPPVADSELKLLVSHQEQVTVLPPGAEVLGGNDFCPNALMTCGPNILGFQGHPEFTPGYSRDLTGTRVSIIPPATVESALKSLEVPPDNATAFRWIVGFLVSRSR